MAQHYESDITRFINEYKTKHPDTEKRQLEGRALLWDKQQDAELLKQFKAARVPQKPYVYQTN
ncbi:DUF3460 family protein [Advenella alkanexedens]|jgi:hypothetical protein|uniref:DUF3460 family protein n=1 Tax=Advenella alkanexedens TaxID=1481665 RepID=A0ABS6NL84_9BURK|nr:MULTISPECIES: DUF3460 family protein [Advenella]MBV4396378.1 DUF3460 family protein [Advenella alkanexedens]MDD3757566.1 DUF3460 family protein [Advenella sp.]NLN66831.1 DUF3460 family protein [Alcaligenaceae bacterium]